MNIAAYDISGAGPNGTNCKKNGVTGNTVTLNALAPGSWTISVDAKNPDGITIASGYTTATVSEGATTAADVTVSPLSGPGVLKIGLAWLDGAISNPAITATLTPKSGTKNDKRNLFLMEIQLVSRCNSFCNFSTSSGLKPVISITKL